MGVSIFATEIPRLKAFEKAAASGEIVSQTNDRNSDRAWDAYIAAGKELNA
jgi:chromosome partitioning protein